MRKPVFSPVGFLWGIVRVKQLLLALESSYHAKVQCRNVSVLSVCLVVGGGSFVAVV